MKKSWQSFWQAQSTPLHRRDSEDFYRKHSAELSLLTGNPAGLSVLDLGCGDGALYRHMGFHRASRYVGLDFSVAMLNEFRRRESNLELVEGSAIDIPVQGKFDIVFSNGLVQYLSLEEFAVHLRNVLSRTAPGGVYVCGSVPSRERFLSLAIGRAAYPPRFSPLVAFKEVVAYLIGRASLGQWYSLRDVEKCAKAANADADVFGSLHYLYRYHLVFRSARSE